MTVQKSQLYRLLAQPAWRLRNLYTIQDKTSAKVGFIPNEAQQALLDGCHTFNVILKARQMGFSTLICIIFLDAAIFRPGITCGIIDLTVDDAKKKLDKIKYAYEHLPDWLKKTVTMDVANAQEVRFSNGSKIQVGTSHRGGTLQYLHVSELGKTSARSPEKAVEIKTGAFNAVPPGGVIFVESTAEGQDGEFFALVKRARSLAESGRELAADEPKFFFFPWYKMKEYTTEARRSIPQKMLDYFEDLEMRHGVKLTDGQMVWYLGKKDEQGEFMTREYPSTPDEAFQASRDGAFYTREMAWLRENRRIATFRYDPRHVVHTFWDIGTNHDYMACWFYQMDDDGGERMIDYLQNTGNGMAWYSQRMKDKGYNYGTCYLPHDGNHKRLSENEMNKSVKEMLEGQGVGDVIIVPRVASVYASIEQFVRPALMGIAINGEACGEGIKCLDNYSRRWNDRLGMWAEEHAKNQFVHGADAFRTYAEAKARRLIRSTKARSPSFLERELRRAAQDEPDDWTIW